MVTGPHGAEVLEVGTGPSQADLGIGDESVVRIIRTDIEETFPIDRVLNAEAELADDLVDSVQAVIINNPRHYVPDLDELGKAVRPGGKIIIQGHRTANPDMRQLIKRGPPKGFVTSVDEGFKTGRNTDPRTVQHNIMGGPFRYTDTERGGGPLPNFRVVYEKPKLNPGRLGEQLALESKGKGSRFDYICRGLNGSQLGQSNAAEAASAATKGIGLELWRTKVGDDVVLASAMPGSSKPILIVKPDGTVVRGQANIGVNLKAANPQDAMTLEIVSEDPPLLPRD
jgi:hypothetical protein